MDISETKGGTTHHTIVRGIAADGGQATVEYAVVLVFVAVAGVVGYQLLGGTVTGLINSVIAAFS